MRINHLGRHIVLLCLQNNSLCMQPLSRIGRCQPTAPYFQVAWKSAKLESCSREEE